MRRIALSALLLISGILHAQQANSTIVVPAAPFPGPGTPVHVVDGPVAMPCATPEAERGLFQSDRAFERFIGPVSSPILSKDPRALTEIRGLFIQNWFPNSNAFVQGGDLQVYAAQVRVALTDRLSFIADKDGIATLSPRSLSSRSGFLDVAAGLKYQVLRDVENQMMVTLGFMYEIPSGEAKVFQNHGSGIWTIFGTAGIEVAENLHLLWNSSYNFGQNTNSNSGFFFNQIHADYRLFEFLYPLAEINWYAFTQGGARGIPGIVGEGDGLINLGTDGMGGRHQVTAAFGLKARLNWHVETGVVYEVPLTSVKENLIQSRLIAELIIRY